MHFVMTVFCLQFVFISHYDLYSVPKRSFRIQGVSRRLENIHTSCFHKSTPPYF